LHFKNKDDVHSEVVAEFKRIICLVQKLVEIQQILMHSFVQNQAGVKNDRADWFRRIVGGLHLEKR
jgi:hypothetical protein